MKKRIATAILVTLIGLGATKSVALGLQIQAQATETNTPTVTSTPTLFTLPTGAVWCTTTPQITQTSIIPRMVIGSPYPTMCATQGAGTPEVCGTVTVTPSVTPSPTITTTPTATPINCGGTLSCVGTSGGAVCTEIDPWTIKFSGSDSPDGTEMKVHYSISSPGTVYHYYYWNNTGGSPNHPGFYSDLDDNCGTVGRSVGMVYDNGWNVGDFNIDYTYDRGSYSSRWHTKTNMQFAETLVDTDNWVETNWSDCALYQAYSWSNSYTLISSCGAYGNPTSTPAPTATPQTYCMVPSDMAPIAWINPGWIEPGECYDVIPNATFDVPQLVIDAAAGIITIPDQVDIPGVTICFDWYRTVIQFAGIDFVLVLSWLVSAVCVVLLYREIHS